MVRLRFNSMSVRARLAAILGVTIFALAASRALGLSQLGSFLDRFKGYTDRLEAVQVALTAAHVAERGLYRELLAAQSVPADWATHPQASALDRTIARLNARFEALRKDAESARTVEVDIMNRTYVTMLILVFGAGVLAYYLIAAMITRPLARVAQVADTVARGDLRSEVQVESEDEIGRVMRSLRDMNVGLASLIGKVRSVSRTVGERSGEIATANSDFAERTMGQSAALEQTAATMAQLSTGVTRTAGNARQASERAASASGIAARGGEDVARVAATMQEIDASARQITEIISVIDGIAFQTNLLALNAAVEAARAGTHGRGFAVVAAEVRNLAQRSAAAAREVKNLIQTSLAKVEQGAGAVRSAAGTMTEIVENSKDVTRIVEEIASLAAQQAHSLEEINRAVSDMDQSTRHNSEIIERASGAAQSMREQAAVLNDAISVFQLSEHGKSPSESGAGAPAGATVTALTRSSPRMHPELRSRALKAI